MNRELFLDDVDIAHTEGLRRTLHQPERHPANPLLRPEHPWESIGVQTYGTVVYDPADGLFRMWYLTHGGPSDTVMINGHERLVNCTLLGYASSRDGLQWEKPDLGQVDFNGSTRNNLLRIGNVNVEGAAILHEPDDPNPQRRYKAFYWEHGGDEIIIWEDGSRIFGKGERDGMWVSFSPDGVHWVNWEGNPVIRYDSDTGQTASWDPALGRYVAYGRFGAAGRKVARSDSPDFVKWSEPRLVLEPDEADGPLTQFYGISVTLYEGLYIGTLWIFHLHPREEGAKGADKGTIDVQLVHSRDGINWERTCERQMFMPTGPPGSWDSSIIQTSCRAVVLDDRVLIYYNGTARIHGDRASRVPSQIGLATLRRDGFVSLDAGPQPGFLMTKPFPLPAGRLHLNVDAAGGLCTAALCDEEGRPLPGFEESRPISGDALDAEVTWPQASALPVGRNVTLRITLQRAALYSYWFG